MTTERIKITETYHDFDLEGPIDGCIQELQELKEKGWQYIYCEINCEGSQRYYPKRTRLETDEEYVTRMKLEEFRKDLRRKQYEQLREEFGND